MKRKHILIVMIAALGLLLLGCMKEEDPPPNKPVPTPTDRYPEPIVTIPTTSSTTTTTRRNLRDDYITTTSTTRAPIVAPPTTAPPTTAPPTTLPPVIHGQCGTTVNSCIAGTLIDTPDLAGSHNWLCKGLNGGGHQGCAQSKPITVKGTGSIKLMAGGTHVGNASISSGYQDITLTKTITNILCTSSDKARVHKLFTSKIATDYWGTEDDEFCGAMKTALNGRPHQTHPCLLYTSPSPRDRQKSRMPSSA